MRDLGWILSFVSDCATTRSAMSRACMYEAMYDQMGWV